jgi:hypothetical protein
MSQQELLYRIVSIGREAPPMSERETKRYIEARIGYTISETTWEQAAPKLGFM